MSFYDSEEEMTNIDLNTLVLLTGKFKGPNDNTVEKVKHYLPEYNVTVVRGEFKSCKIVGIEAYNSWLINNFPTSFHEGIKKAHPENIWEQELEIEEFGIAFLGAIKAHGNVKDHIPQSYCDKFKQKYIVP